jgi:hypothetical protein
MVFCLTLVRYYKPFNRDGPLGYSSIQKRKERKLYFCSIQKPFNRDGPLGHSSIWKRKEGELYICSICSIQSRKGNFIFGLISKGVAGNNNRVPFFKESFTSAFKKARTAYPFSRVAN